MSPGDDRSSPPGSDPPPDSGADPDSDPSADATPDADDSPDDGFRPDEDVVADPDEDVVADPDGGSHVDGTAVGPTPPSGDRRVDGSVGDASAGTDREFESPLARLRHAEEGPWWIAREILLNVGAVVAVGLLLFAISGVWPPMVAVESGSMEPHMHRGDLVFVTAPGRWAPGVADARAGVVTVETARDVDYRTFGSHGSVIVYDNPSRTGPPVIHRAHFWVEEGENWYPRANPEYVFADSCRELSNCPAEHAGYITKGDANSHYDQVNGISGPVKPAWVTGVARLRIPFFGWIRLLLSVAAPPSTPVDLAATTDASRTLATAAAAPVVATTPPPVDRAHTPTPTSAPETTATGGTARNPIPTTAPLPTRPVHTGRPVA